MNRRFIETAATVGLLSIILLLGAGLGCSRSDAPQSQQSSAVVAQNFSQVQTGMTSAQIRQLMGEPGRIKQKDQKVEWEYYTTQGKFEVEFINDRVIAMERH